MLQIEMFLIFQFSTSSLKYTGTRYNVWLRGGCYFCYFCSPMFREFYGESGQIFGTWHSKNNKTLILVVRSLTSTTSNELESGNYHNFKIMVLLLFVILSIMKCCGQQCQLLIVVVSYPTCNLHLFMSGVEMIGFQYWKA